jgi:futalosine hydrolase
MPQIESMEGAAFFYACRQLNVPCLQIRAVSNYVEKRNRDNWHIGLAIKNLNKFAMSWLTDHCNYSCRAIKDISYKDFLPRYRIKAN